MQKSSQWLFLLMIVVGSYGCKSSKTSSGVSPAKSTASSIKTANSSTRSSSNYPAAEYYGNSWNTEHIRLNSDPKPNGNFQLTLLGQGEKFVMPVCGKVLSEFGPRSGSMHTGIDLKLQMNDPVYCAFDGMVRMAQEYGAYGKMVVVRHENGLETVYSHLNTIAVKLNQQVKAGDRIGGGGQTGRATGVHLHFETRFKGETFNPRLLIDFNKCALKSNTLALSKDSYTQYGQNAGTTKQTTASSTTTTAKAKVPETHTVQKGDTLYSISRRYNTSVAVLRQLNNMAESSVLQVGQKLVVR